MLYKYTAREQRWLVAMKIPNKETIKTFKDTDNKVGLVAAKDVNDMFKKLES